MLQALESRFEPGSSSTRIVPLEGLRGFAALLVFLVHFRSLFGQYAQGSVLSRPIEVLGALGHTGVDIFFILSGYLVYGIVLDQRFRLPPFFRRRVRRLYPTFLSVFALYLALELLLPSRSRLPAAPGQAAWYVLLNLLMLPGVLHIRPIIAVAWSLSYEWCFYILLPVVVAVFAVRKWPWIWRAVFFVSIAALCIGAAAQQWLANSRYALFAAGILLWELQRSAGFVRRLPRMGEFAAAALFAFNLLAIGMFSGHREANGLALDNVPGVYTPSLFFTGSMVILYSICYSGFLARMFSWRPLRWVGNMSYSYYLIHGITLVAFRAALQRVVPASQFSAPAVLVLFLGCLVVTVLASSALYLGIEWPLSLARPVKNAPAPSRDVEAPAALPLSNLETRP